MRDSSYDPAVSIFEVFQKLIEWKKTLYCPYQNYTVEITKAPGQQCRSDENIMKKFIGRLGRCKRYTLISKSLIYFRDHSNQIVQPPL